MINVHKDPIKLSINHLVSLIIIGFAFLSFSLAYSIIFNFLQFFLFVTK